jgi:hypothetical protein
MRRTNLCPIKGFVPQNTIFGTKTSFLQNMNHTKAPLKVRCGAGPIKIVRLFGEGNILNSDTHLKHLFFVMNAEQKALENSATSVGRSLLLQILFKPAKIMFWFSPLLFLHIKKPN